MTTIILGTALNGDMGLSLKDRKICFCSMIEQSYLDKATYDSLYIKEPRLLALILLQKLLLLLLLLLRIFYFTHSVLQWVSDIMTTT